MASLFSHFPERPRSPFCENAYLILCNTHAAASSFLETFSTTRQNRNARGAPRDVEQDLLRAALTFASAGLDSMVKQLVVDVLPSIIENDEGANESFRRYVERRIKSSDEIDHKLLADVLVDTNPRLRLISHLVRDLTATSLQSKDALLRVGSFFDIPSSQICAELDRLNDVFLARNQIIHEMDIDFSQPNRSRRPRSRRSIITLTNRIFDVSRNFLVAVDRKLSS